MTGRRRFTAEISAASTFPNTHARRMTGMPPWMQNMPLGEKRDAPGTLPEASPRS